MPAAATKLKVRNSWMAQICRRFNRKCPELLEPKLFNDQTFYRAFMKDLASVSTGFAVVKLRMLMN